MKTFHDLYQHMHWADAAMWQAIAATPGTDDDTRIRELAYHLHLVQHAFTHLWRKTPFDVPKPESFSTLDAIREWAQGWHLDLIPYLATLDPAELQRRVMVPWVRHVEARLGNPPEQTTLADTMLQVLMHSAHHRGQMMTRLRELGGEPPLLDMIMWVWLGRPEAVWKGLP